MNPSQLVKLLALTSLLLSMAAGAEEKWEILPQFECGTYQVKGHFAQNSDGDFILTMRKGSSSPFELMVLEGPFDEMLRKVGSEVILEVEVPYPIKDGKRAFVNVKKFSTAAFSSPSSKRLLKKNKCAESK